VPDGIVGAGSTLAGAVVIGALLAVAASVGKMMGIARVGVGLFSSRREKKPTAEMMHSSEKRAAPAANRVKRRRFSLLS
jgi:hypothetical protein